MTQIYTLLFTVNDFEEVEELININSLLEAEENISNLLNKVEIEPRPEIIEKILTSTIVD